MADARYHVGNYRSSGVVRCSKVDIVCYRITEHEPTELEEATIGTGDQCGSSFIDRAYIRLLETRLRPDDFLKLAGCRSEDISRTSMSPDLRQMVNDFADNAKAVFSGKEYSFMDFPRILSRTIEDDDDRGIVGGLFVISR